MRGLQHHLEYGTHLEKNIVYNYKHIMQEENPYVWSGSRQENGSYTNVAGEKKQADYWASNNPSSSSSLYSSSPSSSLDSNYMSWTGGKKSKRRNHKRSKRRRFSCRRR